MATPSACVLPALPASASPAVLRTRRARRRRLGSGLLVAAAAGPRVTLLPGSAAAPAATQARRRAGHAAGRRRQPPARGRHRAGQRGAGRAGPAAGRRRRAPTRPSRPPGPARRPRRPDPPDRPQRLHRRERRRFDALMTSGSADDSSPSRHPGRDRRAHQRRARPGRAAAAGRRPGAGRRRRRGRRRAADAGRDHRRAGELKAQIADYQAQYDALPPRSSGRSSTEHAGPAVAAARPQVVAAQRRRAGRGRHARWPSSASPTCGRPPARTRSTAPGLTQYAYAAAGVALPHSSAAQSTMGTPVSRATCSPVTWSSSTAR